MFLINRRLAFLFLCLAGMEVAWATPFWLVIYRQAPRPWTAFGLLLAGLLLWMLILELLGHVEIGSPVYEIVTVLLVVLTSLLIVRIALYRGSPLTDFGWLAALVHDTLAFRGGLPPAVGLVAANFFLWQRATVATGRELSFFNVGRSFRLGVLLLIAGAGLLSYLRGISSVSFLWLYFTLGLAAVGLARIDEKARDAQSVGAVLPLRRLAQLLLAVGATVGAAWLLSLVYTPDSLRRLLRLLNPLWRLISPLLSWLITLLARLLSPLFEWLQNLLITMFHELSVQSPQMPSQPVPPQTDSVRTFPDWLSQTLEIAAIIIVVLVAILLATGLLVLYLERVRKGRRSEEIEEEGAERVTFGAGILERGIEALRNAAGMIRRFGLGSRLLAAVSVQNIYANVCRLARERGYPRRPAQPPDNYLPVLTRAFEGLDAPLARITAAYMRVHYGDHPVSMAELAQLREDYRAVRKAEDPRGPAAEGRSA